MDKSMDKNFTDYIGTKLLSVWYNNSYFAQKHKISGVEEKKHDFEMSIASGRMCCTIIVHFIGVPIIKSSSSSWTT